MFDVKTVQVKLSDETIARLSDYGKRIWFGTPRWLRVIVAVTVFFGACYFLYNRLMISYDVDSLYADIKVLNERYGETVYLDKYAYDVNNFVIVGKTISKEVETIYEINQQILGVLADYIERKDPHDPALISIKRLVSQNEFSKESFENIVQHHLKIYGDWAKNIDNKQVQEPSHQNQQNTHQQSQHPSEATLPKKDEEQ